MCKVFSAIVAMCVLAIGSSVASANYLSTSDHSATASFNCVTVTFSQQSFGKDPFLNTKSTISCDGQTGKFESCTWNGYTQCVTYVFSKLCGKGSPVNCYIDCNGKHGIQDCCFKYCVCAVPEPATCSLIGVGIASIGVYGWRKRKAAKAAA